MRNSYAIGEPLQGIKERSRTNNNNLMPKIKQANGNESNQNKKKLDRLFLNNRMLTL